VTHFHTRSVTPTRSVTAIAAPSRSATDARIRAG